MRLLVADLVRRVYRWPVLSAVGVTAVLWFVASAAQELQFAFGVSLAAAFVIGPLMTVESTSRLVRYLPVSRREVWLATWFVSVVMATTAMAVAKLPALLVLLGFGEGGLATLALSGVYDFAAAAIGCGLMTVVQRPPDPDRVWRTRLVSLTVVGSFIMGALMLPVLSGSVPTQWSDLSAIDNAMLVAVLGVATAIFVTGPGDHAQSRRPMPRIRDGSGSRFRTSRVTGLPQLLLQEFMRGASMALVLGVIFGAIAWAGSRLMGMPYASPVDFLRAQRLLIFDGAPVGMTPAGPGGLLIWYAFFGASVAAPFLDLIRHLRVLPISTTKLVALLVAWPAAIWMFVWAVLLGLGAIFAASSRDLHLELWIQLVGLSALARSFSLWMAARHRWLFYSSPVVFVPVFRLVHATGAGWGVVLAFGLIAGAVLLTLAALHRNSTYANVPSFEFEARA